MLELFFFGQNSGFESRHFIDRTAAGNQVFRDTLKISEHKKHSQQLIDNAKINVIITANSKKSEDSTHHKNLFTEIIPKILPNIGIKHTHR